MVDKTNQQVIDLKEEALNNRIPIMEDKTIEYIIDFINRKKVLNILEIGTGVGYSAIRMALSNKDVIITTIERDEKRYLEAIKNVKKFNLENQISLVFNDALEIKIDNKFDLIILDGAKGQNINFFQKFKNNLEEDGYIITDNMFFHGYVTNPDKAETRDLRSLVDKIKQYHEFLKENDDFETEVLSIGDGIAVSTRKNI